MEGFVFLKVCYLLLHQIMSAKRIILLSKKLYFNFWKNLNETYNSDCSFLLWLSKDTLTGWLSVSYCWRIYCEFVTTWSRWFTVVSTANVHGDLLCESLECLPFMNIQGRHLARLRGLSKTWRDDRTDDGTVISGSKRLWAVVQLPRRPGGRRGSCTTGQ